MRGKRRNVKSRRPKRKRRFSKKAEGSGGKSRCLLWMDVDTVSDIKTLSIYIETYSGYDLNSCFCLGG